VLLFDDCLILFFNWFKNTIFYILNSVDPIWFIGVFKAGTTFYWHKSVSIECGMTRIIIFSRGLKSNELFCSDKR